MQAKTITVVIDENGNSSIDLAGFRDNSCAKVAEDFRGGDRVAKERRKASYHQGAENQEQSHTGR
jgi:hypothetical protein